MLHVTRSARRHVQLMAKKAFARQEKHLRLIKEIHAPKVSALRSAEALSNGDQKEDLAALFANRETSDPANIASRDHGMNGDSER